MTEMSLMGTLQRPLRPDKGQFGLYKRQRADLASLFMVEEAGNGSRLRTDKAKETEAAACLYSDDNENKWKFP